MAKEIEIEAGTEILIGAPTAPLSARRVEEITGILAAEAEIREAHIAQVFIPDQIDPPVAVLFLVFADESVIEHVMDRVTRQLDEIAPPGQRINVVALEDSSDLLPAIRQADCMLGYRD
jgi:hypothetical protein